MKNTLLKSLLISATFVLTACQETAPYSREGDMVKRSTVSMVRLAHLLKAEDDQTDTLSGVAKATLASFIKDSGLQHGDVALIDAGRHVSADRIAEVAVFLKKQGIRYGGTGIYGEQPSAGDMKIYLERHVVKVPECGNWAEESSVSRKYNQATPNFGCATARNLGLMVANPKDLIRGEGSTKSNTNGAVKAIIGDGSSSQTPSTGNNQ